MHCIHSRAHVSTTHVHVSQGKAPVLSRYSPLDLFGPDTRLQEAALAALMEAPNNNLKAGAGLGRRLFGSSR